MFPSIESTNTHAMQEAAKGALHGSVSLRKSRLQVEGAVTMPGTSEPYSGIYVSILLRPQLVAEDGLWLSLATGLAVQGAIENVTGVVTDIRWPNDGLLNGRKVGGILVEMNAEASRIRHVVIGIGINVNQGRFSAELSSRATSLRLETNRRIGREEFCWLRCCNA